ncbi:MAG: PAS domain-containing protein [Silicimonas sp.]|nr:PAS domain-containing protein [Silicimonas sp.]
MTEATNDLWQSLPVPAIMFDAGDLIVDANPSAESFLNASLRQVQGKPVFDALAIDAPVDEQARRARDDQTPLFMNNVDVGTGLGAPVSCNIQIGPLQDHPGHLLMLLQPQVLADRLGRAMPVKSAAKSAIGMAEMLAHEIKNPLAGITGAAQLLSMNLGADDQELTDLIVSESRRILALLAQVEHFGNLRPPDCAAVNIHDLLDRARKSASVGFAAHMRLVEDYDPSLPPTWVDGNQLLQVFLNLLKNAAEATGGSPGTIRLRTYYDTALRLRRQGGSAPLPLTVEIIDDGPGLPPEIAANVFDPFVSGRENGTGLGLALVSKIISDHDGWVSVDSGPGRTVFRISLPMASKAQQDEKR